MDKGLSSHAAFSPPVPEAVFVRGCYCQVGQTEGPHQILECRSGRQSQNDWRQRQKDTRSGEDKQALEPRVSQGGGDSESASCPSLFSGSFIFNDVTQE